MWYSWQTDKNVVFIAKMNHKLLYSKQPDKYSPHMAKSVRHLLFREGNKYLEKSEFEKVPTSSLQNNNF